MEPRPVRPPRTSPAVPGVSRRQVPTVVEPIRPHPLDCDTESVP